MSKPRTLIAGYCALHGMHDGYPCPRCVAELQRADQVATLARQLAELHDAHNRVVVYAESLEARLREAEALLLRLTERPAARGAPPDQAAVLESLRDRLMALELAWQFVPVPPSAPRA